MNWYLKVIKQYFDFKGRARRKEFWMFVLFNVLFAFVFSLLDNMLGLQIGHTEVGILYVVYGVFALIPGIAVAVRRLHDIEKPGYMLLVALIPIIGPIWLIVLYAKEGGNTSNKYGADPKVGIED